MNRIYFAISFLSLLLPCFGQSEPQDTALICGKLDNGLTYYVRHNERPAGKVDFFIAQRVGSVNEAENERGLAHFLEHMCFNGTENFPGNSLISYLESIGVRFGAHLNAYTSTDETVYNICQVPSDRQSALDSCFMILRDWSCGLLLRDEDIEAERGVIVNEWRQRSTAVNRMLTEAGPRLFGTGSRYGNRMPIGLMEVVKNFEPQVLRDYYHRWYYPANQAVIVVGDIDTAYAVERIKAMFADIPAFGKGGKPVADEVYAIADCDSLNTIVMSDPEQASTMIQLYFRYDNPGRRLTSSEQWRNEVVDELLTSALAHRFDTIEAKVSCPHTSLAVGDVKYLLSGKHRAFVMRGFPKQGRGADAVRTWNTEMRRAVRHGFVDDELAEARREAEAALTKRERVEKATTNTVYARRYVRNYIDGGSRASVAEEIAAKRALLPRITAADITERVRAIVDTTGRNTVLLVYQPQKNDAPLTEDALAEAFKAVDGMALKPYVPESVAMKPLLACEPEPGVIAAVDSLPQFGAKVYTLGNGLKVWARQSDAKPGQIYLRATRRGGLSQVYRPEDLPTLKMINEITGASAAGEHSQADLRRLLVGRDIRVSSNIAAHDETFEIATVPNDFTDAMRLLYLKITDLRPDTVALNMLMAEQRHKLEHQYSNPVQVMGDSIHRIVYSSHPLAAKLDVSRFDEIDPAKAIDVYRDRMSDMTGFDFFVTGDFSEDSIEMLMSRYIATLPASGKVERPLDMGYRYNTSADTIVFKRAMSTPQPILYTFTTGPVDYNLPNVVAAGVFSQVLRSRLLADLREERGWTYSARARCSVLPGIDGVQPASIMMPVYIKVSPGHEHESAAIVAGHVHALATEGPDGDEILKAKEQMLQSARDAADDNAYWLGVLKAYARNGVDLHTDYAATVEALTPDAVKHFVAKYVDKATAQSATTCIIMESEQAMNADE